MHHGPSLFETSPTEAQTVLGVLLAGGYYMAMGCHAIVAEGLTITGSIGVVAATFNLKEVYRRIGFTKEVISRGRSVTASLRLPPRPALQASAALCMLFGHRPAEGLAQTS